MIVPVHAGNPGPMTGSGNWTYLLRGRVPLLIDAGVGTAAHLDELAQHAPDGPRHVIVTHVHGDHASGVEAIAARWPATRFSKYSWPERDRKYAVDWHGVSDGHVLDAGDARVEVVHTPGHSPDHVALWEAESRTLFAGDLVVQGSTVVIMASAGGSLSQYLHSLQRAIDLAPARILPAHGPPIDDPLALLHKYIAHRHQRELQVRDALDAGARTVEAIVARIYVGLADVLVPMARESVLAHLVKLQDDGRVVRLGNEWESADERR